MKRIILPLLVLSLFIIQYEEYFWDPCNGTTCLTIYCPDIRGCKTDGQTFYCNNIQCAETVLNKQGTEHLTGVWKVDLLNGEISKMKTINKISVSEGDK